MYIQLDEADSNKLCHFCAQLALKQAVIVNDAPAYLGCTRRDFSEDIFLSFRIYVCKECGLLQTDAIPLDTTYGELHSEALGPTWERHHASLAQWIDAKVKDKLKAKSLVVLELGASAQPLARKLQLVKEKIYYIDPIKKPPFSLNRNELYISGYFPEVKPDCEADLIIASHVVEHIPKTAHFFQAVLDQLRPDGIFVMSIPHFKIWFQQAYFNAISAEHVIYPFQEQLVFLARKMGLTIEFNYFDEHSLFAVFSKNNEIPTFSKHDCTLFEDNLTLLRKWVASFQSAVAIPVQNSEQVPTSYFITGASHLSQYVLLSNPEIEKKIDGVLDNSDRKWGLRLYGTSIKACSFEKLADVSNPIVFLTPSPYQNEMEKQIIKINRNTALVKLK